MKKSIIALLVLFSFSLVFTNTITAQKRGLKGERMLLRAFENLDLTEEQRNQIEDLNYDFRMKAIELNSQKRQNNLAISKLLKDSKIDENEILKLNEKNNSIINELSKMRIEKRIKTHKILTPEQREQIGNYPRYRDEYDSYGPGRFGRDSRGFKGDRQYRFRCY